jgi:hypothetical protein
MYLPPEIRRMLIEEMAKYRAKKEQVAATTAKPSPEKKP